MWQRSMQAFRLGREMRIALKKSAKEKSNTCNFCLNIHTSASLSERGDGRSASPGGGARTEAASVVQQQRGHHKVAFELEQVKTPAPEDESLFQGADMRFPCLTKNKTTGPEPVYASIAYGYKKYHYDKTFYLSDSRHALPAVDIAYETWGELNEDKSNAVLIQAGLSASSHARSHEENINPGWWEKFVGPGRAVDTDKFFVICTNNLGSCYGTTGPSSTNPFTSKQYGTTFPVISIHDMVRTQFLLLDRLGIEKLHGAVGSSLGGMLSLTSAVLFPQRVGRLVSISSCVKSHPSSIALRYLQRKAIMTDPNWNNGHYYGNKYPKMGMKLAREIATLTYRSGPEWDQRFGRQRIEENVPPSLCPTFMIENYLDYQGESFSTKLDPNSLLYISKAMDLFDLSEPYGYDLKRALSRVNCPVMVIGVQTDVLFPVWQQQEMAGALRQAGNDAVTYYELNSLYGHDTFLLDLNGVGAGVKGFLETNMAETGYTNEKKKEDEIRHNKDRLLF